MITFIKKILPKSFRDYLRAFFFSFYTICHSRTPFTIFFKKNNQWKVWIKNKQISVSYPSLSALEYYRCYVPERGTIIYDVGGELGLETVQFAELCGSEGQVHVFECFPSHIRLLEEIKGKYPQITLHDVACWNRDEELTFHVGNSPGSGTAVSNAKGQRAQNLANVQIEPIKVRAKRLDDIWALNHRHVVDFLKMDIEGAEYEALEGASELLKNTRHIVIAAYHIRDGVPTAAKVERSLKEAGFITQIHENLHVYGWR